MVVTGSLLHDIRRVSPVPARHVVLMRGINHERRPTGRRTSPIFPAARAAISPLHAATFPAARAATPHPVLERSRRLRDQTASHLQVMRQRMEVTCSVMAEIQETLAAVQVTLQERQDARRAV